MRILIVTPAPPRSRSGNRVTALRWARRLRELGHRVTVAGAYLNQRCDLLVALHARRSAASIGRFHKRHADRPIVVALTGTDVYGDLADDASAQRSVELASRLVVLQPLAVRALPRSVRGKAGVIHQSAAAPGRPVKPSTPTFDVCVIGHLRPVKDPFRAAEASRLLPVESRIRILHAGGALNADMAKRARREMKENPRYHWLGELPRWRSMRLLGRSRMLVLSSIAEGGANVISEAIAVSVPVLASRVPGSVGLLGSDYPGYFRVGDTRSLARLLGRTERDAQFLMRLKNHVRKLAPLVRPARERRAWADLLRGLASGPRCFDTRHSKGGTVYPRSR